MSEVNNPAGPPSAPAAPSAPVAGTTDPNKTLGIVALVLAIVASIVGAIIGIVAYTKSKKAGYKNGFALAAIIVGFVFFVIQVISIILLIVAGLAVGGAVADLCEGQATGTYELTDGTTIECP